MLDSKILDNLNEEQRAPASVQTGPVLVTAGAGSGKTRMLTHRIAHLVRDLGVQPSNILAITFTNKAANEMKERLALMIENASEMWVCTFHAMCARILRREADKIGYTKSFSIYSDTDSEKIIKKIVDEVGTTLGADSIAYHISNAKNHLLLPDSYGEFVTFRSKRNDIVECYKRYEAELKKSNAMDFDDLLNKTYMLFANSPETLAYYQNMFKYIHVDEFQDTNTVQYELVKLLGGENMNVFAVGDEDQCIYSWRGAEVGNILSFSKDFAGTKVFKLEQNYRSTKNILTIANKLIKKNFNRMEKNLWTKQGSGARVEEYTSYNETEEAEYVAETIKSLCAYSGYNYRDFAILMRVNSLSRVVEEKMITYGIPYKVYGGHKFFERKEIKDVTAYLRLLVNPLDNDAVRRVLAFPKKGIGDVSMGNIEMVAEQCRVSMFEVLINDEFDVGALRKKLAPVAEMYDDFNKKQSELSLYEFTKYVIEKSGIKAALSGESEEDLARRMNIDDFLISVKEFEDANENPTMEDYLSSITLYRDIDSMDDEDNSVSLITVHAAKGLEFKVVFVIGLNEHLFPLSRAINSDDDNELEEERRLMYVAITRAKERLFLTRPRTKFSFESKRSDYTVPSRFLAECKSDDGVTHSARAGDTLSDRERILKKFRDNPDAEPEEEKPQEKCLASSLTGVPKTAYKSFQKGTIVEHPHLGRGEVIIPVTDMNSGYITIKFDSCGNKTLSLKFANLKIIQ